MIYKLQTYLIIIFLPKCDFNSIANVFVNGYLWVKLVFVDFHESIFRS